ncbi:MAG: signal recognition particle-docking protein FtsY [Euryarchaeota archaeon RBG_19FT_COMBO_56_21]|nr:MAG: signal recognition particle-docking protein FtsY [Euryarchaeota archaeon RBG_19FT_COMBO_56_21]
MFKGLRERFSSVSKEAKTKSIEDISEVVDESGRRLKESMLDDLLMELQLGLLEADVALPVAEELTKSVKASLLGKRIDKSFDIDEAVRLALRAAVKEILEQKPFALMDLIKKKPPPFVIMFVGINGGGKTTAIAKLAYRMQKHGLSIVLAAGDTFRAGAIEQLTLHSEKLGCKVIKHQEGSDPAAVAYDAIDHAKARKKDIVLVDTAGRMQTNTNLMDEMKKIRRVAKPDIVFFVGDALAGSDAVEQAKRFDDAVGIDGVILTKVDADAKGGAALSIAKTIGKPIAYVSIGQEYDEFRRFDPEWMVARIFNEPQAKSTETL